MKPGEIVFTPTGEFPNGTVDVRLSHNLKPWSLLEHSTDKSLRYSCSQTFMQYVEHTLTFLSGMNDDQWGLVGAIILSGGVNMELLRRSNFVVKSLVFLHDMQNFNVFDLEVALEKYFATELLNNHTFGGFAKFRAEIDEIQRVLPRYLVFLIESGYANIIGADSKAFLEPLHHLGVERRKAYWCEDVYFHIIHDPPIIVKCPIPEGHKCDMED